MLMFLFAIVIPLPVCCATYYVDATNGNDSNKGTTKEFAWQTISKVNSFSFSDGDTVKFKRGEVWNKTVLTLDSASAHNMTIEDYGSGSKPFINGNSIEPIVIIKEINNLTIRNIDISGQDWRKEKCSNLYVEKVNGLTIDGIIGNGHYGGNESDGKTAITIKYCSGKIIIKNCHLYNWGPSEIPSLGTDFMGLTLSNLRSGNYDIYNNTIHNVNADCIQIYECEAEGNVHDNIIYNAGEDGIDLKGTSNVEIYNNEFYRTHTFTGKGGSGGFRTHIIAHEGSSPKSSNIDINNNNFHDGDAIAIRIGHVENITISKNIFKNNLGVINIGNHSKNTKIHHNILINPKHRDGWHDMDAGCIYENNSYTGTKIFNNTIYNTLGECKHLISIASSNATEIFDNIAYMESDNSEAYCFYCALIGAEPIVQNNCWYNEINNNRINYRGTIYSLFESSEWKNDHEGAIFSDPLFNDPTTGDFSLEIKSPCRIENNIIGAIYHDLTHPENIQFDFEK